MDAATSPAATARSSTASPSSAAISSAVRRVIPSSTPAAGVLTVPARTTKMLKPGPSTTLPSRSVNTAVSPPCS